MKRFILFLLIITAGLYAKADCAWEGIWCWPQTSTVKTNGIFVVEFYGGSQVWANGLGTTKKIYLRSGKEKIQLIVEEVCVGRFGLTQTLLRPQHKLRAGKAYQIALDSSGEEITIRRYSSEEKKYVATGWTAVEEEDKIIPEWKTLPVFTTTSYTHFGCGPAMYAQFSLSYSDKSDVLVKTTLTNLATGKKTSYYLTSNGDKLLVGHGMCSGAFSYDAAKEYQVVFSLLDASGNKGCEQTKPIRFSKPEQKDREE